MKKEKEDGHKKRMITLSSPKSRYSYNSVDCLSLTKNKTVMSEGHINNNDPLGRYGLWT